MNDFYRNPSTEAEGINPPVSPETISINQHTILVLVAANRAKLLTSGQEVVDESYFTVASAGFSKPIDPNGATSISAAEIAEDPESHLRKILGDKSISYLFDPNLDSDPSETISTSTTLYLHAPFHKRGGFNLTEASVLTPSRLANLKPEDRSVVIPFNLKSIEQFAIGKPNPSRTIVTATHTGINIPFIQFTENPDGTIHAVRTGTRVSPEGYNIHNSCYRATTDDFDTWLKKLNLRLKSASA